jgi:hypothetical protein
MIPLIMFWESGSFPIIIGTAARDIYGNLITLGATVKLVGVVTAINTNDPHYGEIQVVPVHPGASPPFVPDTVNGAPQSPNFPVSNPQTAAGPYGFHPSQLIVGV